jgi:hypothetical protein
MMWRWLGKLYWTPWQKSLYWTSCWNPQIHKTTATVGNERGDFEITDCVVLSHGQDNCLTPESVDQVWMLRWHIMMIVTTVELYIPMKSSHIHLPRMVLLRPTSLWKTQPGRKSFTTSVCTWIYVPNPIGFLPVVVNTSGRVSYSMTFCAWFSLNAQDFIAVFWPIRMDHTMFHCDKFLITLIMYTLSSYRQTTVLTGELREESDHFRFFHSTWLANLKWSVDLTLPKTSVNEDFHSPQSSYLHGSSFLPHFIRTRRSPLLLLIPLSYFLNVSG